MKTEKSLDDLWANRSLSTFHTFSRSQQRAIKDLSISDGNYNDDGFNSNNGINGGDHNKFSTFTSRERNGNSSGSSPIVTYGTLPKVNILKKAKPVSVPIISIPDLKLLNGKESPSPNNSHSKSFLNESQQNNLNNLPRSEPVHFYSNSYSLSGTSNESDFDIDPTVILSSEDEKVLEIYIALAQTESRFGFSVIGGLDEGFPPCIDEITPGSPADKADLEVGDEILEVNGRSLEDATHTEVISHIHQCIRSRTICLRVKRRSGNKLALDLASQSNVQDAFVIAVEQQARERLEKLSALKKIKPVDMTKLSQQLSEIPSVSGDASELNGLIEAATGSPIYVTSVPELSSSQTALHRTTTGGASFEHISISSGIAPGSGSQSLKDQDFGLSPSPALSVPRGSGSGTRRTSADEQRSPLQFLNGKQLSASGSRRSSESSSVFVGKSEAENISASGGVRQIPNGQYTTSVHGEKPITSPKPVLVKSSPKPRKDITGSQESVEAERVKPSVHSFKERGSKSSSRESVGDPSQYANMINMVEWDNGPHREMAVDVPDSFIPRNKTPPRYPPSRNGATPGHPMTHNGAPGKPVPPPRINEKESWNVNNNNTQVPHVAPRTILSQNKTSEISPSTDQTDRIRKYQEELKKRKEQEERQAKEEEFLRTSLRGSKKLQALESARRTIEPVSSQATVLPSTGFVNDAYETVSEEYVPFASHHDLLLKKPIGISELVASLQRVQEALKKNGMQLEDTVSAVGLLMKTPEFQRVLAVHNKVQDVWCFNSPPTPMSAHSHQLVQECLGSLYNCSVPEATELVEILSRINFDGLLYAHDKIAEREKLLLSTETPLNLGESVDEVIHPKPIRSAYIPETQTQTADDHIKVVRIEKTQDPLGATVRNDGEAVIIGRIVKGGAAERSNLLHEGDEILEVNGIEMRGKTVNEVCDILSRMTGTLTFLVIPGQIPNQPISQRREILIHVRAHFDYDPEDDIYVPCRELGIAFSKGDVLHVISQEDPNWWQAHREGEEDQALAGLIPSKSFQEQRETVKQTLLGETETREKSKKGTLLCAKTHRKKKKKIPYSTAFNDDFDAEEIPTYEEVALYYPRASFKRPVVLIGPPNIGRHELRQRLMQESDRFAAAVPHTSRTRKDGEIDGQDYHFISRAQFEGDILGRKFVEHGEFEKAYYGTSLDAIRSVVNMGRICVLNLHPQSLKILRNSDLKPYIVFVAPPALERLKQMRISRGEAYKEDELIDIIEKAREMEEKYGHYFDLVIVNNDIDRTYHDLVQRINFIEREPQWVPAFWLKQ